nr:hypothetical protein [Tanacetum cinerariifolium]
MSYAFADTHNMVAILTKSGASEGFYQIVDFLNDSYIQYALTVNPHIYISCIKQFWNTVTVKQSTGVTRFLLDPAAEPNVPVATPTVVPVTASYNRTRKGIIIRDPEEESTLIKPTKTKSKDKAKGIMIEGPKPMKKKDQVELDKEYARKLHKELNKEIDWDMAIEHMKQKAKEDKTVQRYQVMKKRPQTEAQARKNMMIYLKNTARFKLDYFKGLSYDDIRPIFEAMFNTNLEFLLKSKEQMEEEDERAIASINETPAQKAAKRRKLNEEAKEIEDLKQHLEIVPNEDDDVYTKATPLARKLLELILPRSLTQNTKCFNAAGEELSAAKHKVKDPLSKGPHRDALRLADAEGFECLPNKEIFTELLRMRVGNGYFREDTPLFEGMIVAQEVGKGANDVNVEDVPTACVAAEGVTSVADDDVNAAVDEPSIPSPTPPTQSPPPSQDIPSTLQGKEVRDEEQAKSVQAEETEERGIIKNIDADEDVILEDTKDVIVEKTAEIEEITAASAIITAADTPIPAATITHAASKLTTAPSASRKRKGVVIRDPEETSTPSTIIYTEPKSKDNGKGIMVYEPKPLKKKTQIEQDEAYARELEA